MNPVDNVCTQRTVFNTKKRNSKVLRNMAQMDTRLNIAVIERIR